MKKSFIWWMLGLLVLLVVVYFIVNAGKPNTGYEKDNSTTNSSEEQVNVPVANESVNETLEEEVVPGVEEPEIEEEEVLKPSNNGAGGSSGSGSEDEEIETLEYVNTFDGVSVNYPSTWDFVSVEIDGELVEMLVPKEHASEYSSFNARVGADTIDVPEEELDAYVEDYEENYVETLDSDGWSVVSQKDTELLGFSGREIVSEKDGLKQRYAYSIRYNLVMYVAFISESDAYDDYLPVVEDMQGSYALVEFG